jgi:glyoxylase-like metal-dependent hydrolase (beta-lactamase superfamily II)
MFGAFVTRAIDVMHLDRDRVICAYDRDGAIVDPGPATCADTLIDALDPAEPRVLLLTHIHLDHAGAAGVLAERFPELVVYVHEVGAPHLADPSKLLKSAQRLYGPDMGTLWGEVLPVPEERIRPLAGGETVEGLRVAATPGHAAHHVCYFSEDSGEAFVGDVAGVRIPPAQHTLAPTPPPDIDVEAWLDSLHTVAQWNPATLCLTHFGPFSDVEEQLHRQRTALLEQADRVRGEGEEEFIRRIDGELAEVADPDTVASFIQAAPPEQLWQGLERYWRKKAEEAA